MGATKEDSVKQKEGENKNNNNNWENKTSGYREPSWYANIRRQPIKFARLTSNVPPSAKVDVIVVGGGIAGMTTAYLLSKSGKKVIVIDNPDSMELQNDTGRIVLLYYAKSVNIIAGL